MARFALGRINTTDSAYPQGCDKRRRRRYGDFSRPWPSVGRPLSRKCACKESPYLWAGCRRPLFLARRETLSVPGWGPERQSNRYKWANGLRTLPYPSDHSARKIRMYDMTRESPNTPLALTAANNVTDFRSDSCSIVEFQRSNANGGVGTTTNSGIVLNVLKKEMLAWRPTLQLLIDDNPSGTRMRSPGN